MRFSGPLMLDSGGFVLSKNANLNWSVGDVGDFIEKLNADIFVSLDIPPGLKDTAAVRNRKSIRSARNFHVLADRFPDKVVMPVVHGRTLSEIELSLQRLATRRTELKWIGLGGMVPLFQHRNVSGLRLAPEIFIGQALKMVRSALPRSKVHVFGAGGTRTFPVMVAMGANSADSIGWRQAAGFGSIFLPLKSQRTVKWNAETGPPRKLLDDSDLAQIEACKCPTCINRSLNERVRAFKKNYYNRAIHNAWTIVNQTRFWPRSRRSLINAVADGELGSNWARAIEASG